MKFIGRYITDNYMELLHVTDGGTEYYFSLKFDIYTLN